MLKKIIYKKEIKNFIIKINAFKMEVINNNFRYYVNDILIRQSKLVNKKNMKQKDYINNYLNYKNKIIIAKQQNIQ